MFTLLRELQIFPIRDGLQRDISYKFVSLSSWALKESLQIISFWDSSVALGEEIINRR